MTDEEGKNMNNIILALKHINKVADELYYELDSWEVYDEVLIRNKI